MSALAQLQAALARKQGSHSPKQEEQPPNDQNAFFIPFNFIETSGTYYDAKGVAYTITYDRDLK